MSNWNEPALNLVRWLSIKWLILLIKPLDLIDLWFEEDQRANTIKRHVLKDIGVCLQILITIVHSTMNTNWRGLCI